jgi:hypothetical protein
VFRPAYWKFFCSGESLSLWVTHSLFAQVRQPRISTGAKKSTRQDWPTLIFYAFHTAGVTWRASVRVSYFNN